MPTLSKLSLDKFLIEGLTTGKKWAEGNFSASGNIIVIRGLSFQPKIIVSKYTPNDSTVGGNYKNLSIHVDKSIFGLVNDIQIMFDGTGSDSISAWTKYSDGFEIAVTANADLAWIAYE